MAGVKVHQRYLGAEIKRRNKATLAAVKWGAVAGARRGRAHMVRVSPKDEGMLKAAWKVVKKGTNEQVSLINDAPYAGVMESGARPHPVSRDGRAAIEEWAQRHLRRKDTRKRKRDKKEKDPEAGAGEMKQSRKKEISPEARRFAGAIIYNIQKYGYRGTRFPLYWMRAELPTLGRFAMEETEGRIRKMANRKAPREVPSK